MNGLYGNMMSYFQGQFIDLEYFDMLPKINAGYDDTKTKEGETAITTDFRGCFQNLASNEVKDSNGNISTVISGNLWSDIKLELGIFVKNPEENPIYRVKKDNPWNREGGFYYYDVIQVVGDDGKITKDIIFNKGEGNFS
jgi:hypothetical protein